MFAQRRDAARELKTLREEMTQEVLRIQIAKERADDSLAQLLVSRHPSTHTHTLVCSLCTYVVFYKIIELKKIECGEQEVRSAGGGDKGQGTATGNQGIEQELTQAEELTQLRAQLRQSLQQQQVSSPFAVYRIPVVALAYWM